VTVKQKKKLKIHVKDLPIGFFLFKIKNGLTFDQIVDTISSNKKVDLLESYK